MTRPRTRSKRRPATQPPRRAPNKASERWLLLLMIVVVITILMSLIGPSPRVRPSADGNDAVMMAAARASNAAVPIEWRRQRRARPYRFRGGPAAREQAVECLATAALYEAGEDRDGQAAVIQVVLNRVRARGFPKTICGTVYQGHARTTGCQFSFTCDGSLQRRSVHAGWRAARLAARRALAGRVFADVGEATHYHTDWMVPYWRDSLVKVARVGTHLFYVRR